MKWLGISVAIVAALIIAYVVLFPGATVRYRLTLSAESDGVSISSASINEVTYRKNPRVLGASAEIAIDAIGEAVELNFGPKGKLFALLQGGADSRSGADWIVLRAFDFPGGAVPSPVEEGLKKIRALSGIRELPLGSLPLLVRFEDINDPMTIRKVDPLNLEASFGPSTKLTSASLEVVSSGIWPLSWYGITGEPLTNKIRRSLPWLQGLKGKYISGRSVDDGSALGLHGGDFKRG
jgi:hypothetical protein